MKTRKGLSSSIHDSDTGFTRVYKLYDTNILTYERGGIRLNTGGWKSNHTKNCMNDNLPVNYRVFQKNFEWFVETPKGTLEFTDNMVITLGE